MERTEEKLFALIRQRLSGGAPVEIPHQMLNELYALAQKHELAHILADTPAVTGLVTDQDAFQRRLLEAHYRSHRYQQAYQELCQCFQNENIPFIPLKGLVLRESYPEKWMRTSCDMDIALRPEDMERAAGLLESALAYRPKAMSDHDRAFISEDGVRVELHHTLIENDPVLASFWDHALPEEGCRFRLEPAYFYLYHIAHMAKHFRHGGCGIRPLLDLWLMERAGMEPPVPLLEQCRLAVFGSACRRLAHCWFEGGPVDDDLRQMQDLILRGGIFGSAADQRLLKKASGAKPRHLSRIFVPSEELQYTYPVLRQHRWMLPVCQLRRWGSLLLGSKARRRREGLRAAPDLTREQIEAAAGLLARLEL